MRLVIAALVLAAVACGGSTEARATTTPKEAAWYSCTTAIQKKFNLSILKAEDFDPSEVALQSDGTYIVQVYYPDNGETFHCIVEELPNGDRRVVATHE